MPPTTLRADAALNRGRILAAARELLIATPDMAMSAVAEAAGVGKGTLYRNFATREDLLVELYRADVEALVAAAPDDIPADALGALRDWLDRVADYARVKRGVLSALDPRAGQELAASQASAITATVARFLDAAAPGTLRDDVTADDVIALLTVLNRLDADTPAARVERILDIIVGGLRARDRSRASGSGARD